MTFEKKPWCVSDSGSDSDSSKPVSEKLSFNCRKQRRFGRGGRYIPEKPGTQVCCGSDTVFPDSVLSDTGNFTRQAAGK